MITGSLVVLKHAPRKGVSQQAGEREPPTVKLAYSTLSVTVTVCQYSRAHPSLLPPLPHSHSPSPLIGKTAREMAVPPPPVFVVLEEEAGLGLSNQRPRLRVHSVSGPSPTHTHTILSQLLH